jgi:hypothetical protein
MRLPTRIHGVLDYVLAALLIASPWLLGFAAGGPETWVPVGAGVVLLTYTLVTDHERGAVRRLPVPHHLLLDALLGVLLAVSPWLLGFDTRAWIPHVVLGAVVIVAAAITDTVPGYDRRRTPP